MELPRIASHTSISPTNIELLNYNHNAVSSDYSGDETELLLLKPGRGTPAGRKPLSACITDHGGAGSGNTAGAVAAGGGGAATAAAAPGVPVYVPNTFTVIPGVGAAFQPSRKREEACALQNLKRRVQQLRLMKANQQEPVECNINARDRDNNTQDLDNRPQLFQKRFRLGARFCSEVTPRATVVFDWDFQSKNCYRSVFDWDMTIARSVLCGQQILLDLKRSSNEFSANMADIVNIDSKIISNRPVSMVLDSAELRTAWQDSDFITDCLCWHNVYRQRHSAPPLSMSTQLCHYAQTWANHLAHTNTFYYRNDKDVGQNLFCRPSNALQTDVSGQEVASYWYMAVKQYDFTKEPDVLHANVNAGHFTQLVWIKSRHFGVGKARSRSGKVIVVANYSPTGNISGHFQSNVLPPMPDYSMLPPPPTFRNFNSETTDTESTTSDSTSTR